ncbi:MAG: hypothetical protein Kow0065_03220 [Methylomicrobium sp.]
MMVDTGFYRVLMVEDDPGDANLISRALRASQKARFEIDWVTTLAEAERYLRNDLPDVVLLDLSLPDSNGLDTVDAMRKAADILPLIVLTGHDDTRFALSTLDRGAQDYLVKGDFDTEGLVRAIRYAIGRGRLEQRLSETGMHLRTLINAMPDIVCFKDGEGRWLEANDFDIKLFQLEGIDYRGKKDSELAVYQDFYKAAFLACEASDEKTWQAGVMTRNEETIPRPDGSSHIFDVMKIPLFHEDGRRKGLVIVGRDVTESKRAEARQRLSARVFETAGEAILVTDADANIVAVNPAFTRITGYSEADVLGKNPRLLSSGRHSSEFWTEMWQSLLTKGEWAGEVWNRRKNGENFLEWETVSSVRDEFGNIAYYVALFADLSEIRKARETAEKLAWQDPLTGLANRAMFLKQLEQTVATARRGNTYADVLLLNLDRFKDINEARGLAVGDALLKAVAAKFSEALTENDRLARLDSDEFAVLLPRFMPSREAAGREALAVAEKLRTVLKRGVDLDDERLHLDASIGIAVFPEASTETAVEVLRQADMAMHRAKSEGGGRALFFETTMGDAVKERFKLEGELRTAISDNQLLLYLQPQIDKDGVQVGAEALIRWQHPERGLVMPGVFIPVAEATDMIVALDRWMLAAVCKVLAQLDAEGRSIRLSVNISPKHFERPDFVSEVKRHLASSGADPTHLVLEVTESLMIGNLEDVVAKMTVLSALGIHFSMDDFGTGYSSLAYLKRLPIHEIKIDKSFIQDAPTDPNDAALVETILAVAHHMSLRVVAEGVETPAQSDFLSRRGNVIYQGYFYGRPEPVDVWLTRLRSGRSA